MAVCAKCGAEIMEGARFCTVCGTPVEQKSEPVSEPMAPAAEEAAAAPAPEPVAAAEPAPEPVAAAEPAPEPVAATSRGGYIGLDVQEYDMTSGEEPAPIVGTYGPGGSSVEPAAAPQAAPQPATQPAAAPQAAPQPATQPAAAPQAAPQPVSQAVPQAATQTAAPKAKKGFNPLFVIIPVAAAAVILIGIFAVSRLVGSSDDRGDDFYVASDGLGEALDMAAAVHYAGGDAVYETEEAEEDE